MDANAKKISNAVFTFKWNTQNGELKTTEVRIPDLKDSKTKVWGDWGPMYVFDLNTTSPVEFCTDGLESKSAQSELKLYSPVSVKERLKTPFYTTVSDEQNKKLFRLYFDHDMKTARVEVLKHQPEPAFVDLAV